MSPSINAGQASSFNPFGLVHVPMGLSQILHEEIFFIRGLLGFNGFCFEAVVLGNLCVLCGQAFLKLLRRAQDRKLRQSVPARLQSYAISIKSCTKKSFLSADYFDSAQDRYSDLTDFALRRLSLATFVCFASKAS